MHVPFFLWNLFYLNAVHKWRKASNILAPSSPPLVFILLIQGHTLYKLWIPLKFWFIRFWLLLSPLVPEHDIMTSFINSLLAVRRFFKRKPKANALENEMIPLNDVNFDDKIWKNFNKAQNNKLLINKPQQNNSFYSKKPIKID